MAAIRRIIPIVLALVALEVWAGPPPAFRNSPPVTFALSPQARGVLEVVNNIVNVSVVSWDPSVLRAEYQTGFILGHLQGDTVAAARDNTYGNDPPSPAALASESAVLNRNFNYLIRYIQNCDNPQVALPLARLLFRMVGIYHGATLPRPLPLDCSGAWLPGPSTFQAAELRTGFGTPAITFMDVYFINASMDLADVLNGCDLAGAQPRIGWHLPNGRRCTAFLKRLDGDLVMAHTTWSTFQSQTMAVTLDINGDAVTMNALGPGQIGSGSDFGYNNKGIMFCETSNSRTTCLTRVDGLFMFLRAALAQDFADSLDAFFAWLSLDNTGTYLNAYLLADARTLEAGLVDMSQRQFVFLHCAGGAITGTTKPPGLSPAFDPRLVTPDYFLGFNFPAALAVRTDLQSTDGTPDRLPQLLALVPGVAGVEPAKAVITHMDPAAPDSIFGRFDLPALSNPAPTAFGSIDAKVATASMARAFGSLWGGLDPGSGLPGFWMRFGTATLNGEPFIWSRSAWAFWQHPGVPDRLDGVFTLLNTHLY